MRDLNSEHKDSDDRKYAYDFDYILRDYLLQTFAPFFSSGSALELGCYQGVFTSSLAKYFSDLTVIEGSSDLIQIAKKRADLASVKFINALFEEALPQRKFDHIFLMHTLEHLEQPVEVLKRIKSWLAPNGRLFVVCPNAHAASRQIAVKMGLIEHCAAVTEGERLHGHRKTYSLDTLENDVRIAGLKTFHRGGIFFKPFANFQFDKLIKNEIIDKKYLDGCYQLGFVYPELSASIFTISTL